MTFADEINALMAKSGKTQAQLAKDLGVSRQAVQFWASGRSEPKGPNLIKYREYVSNRSVETYRVASTHDDIEENWLRVNILDVYASCGGGSPDDSSNIIVGAIDFYKPFLRQLPGVTGLSDNFDIIHSTGDSMEPTIQRKAVCLVDRRQNSISTDAIYCIQAENNLFIKRVLRNFDGSITLISDNDKYPPQTVPKAMLENARIIGRVVLVMNADAL